MIGDWSLRRPIGGALHSVLFARTRVAAWDRGRYNVLKDATPGEAWFAVFVLKGPKSIRFDSRRVGIESHTPEPRTHQGVASFQTQCLEKVPGVDTRASYNAECNAPPVLCYLLFAILEAPMLRDSLPARVAVTGELVLSRRIHEQNGN